MDTPVSSVTKQISEAFLRDPRTSKSVIDVSFNQGVVVLTGKVQSATAVQAAEEIARSVPEVMSVINELKVG